VAGLRSSFEALHIRRGILREALGVGLVASAFSLCLFGECQTMRESRALSRILGEVGAALTDSGTQWMVFLCVGIYLLAFAVLRRRVVEGGKAGTRWNATLPGELWLTGLVAVAALVYVFDYEHAAKSTQALVLLSGAVLGKGVALWESRKQKTENRNGGSGIVLVLIVLLLLAAEWQTEAGHFFQYRGQARWSGPWDNPNTFGVLMGVGVVLAVGSLRSKVQSLKSKVQSPPNAECGVRNAEFDQWRRRALRGLGGCFLLAAAGVMGVGLVRSYSRGAWVGAVVGLAYLIANAESRKLKAEIGPGLLRWAGRRWVALAIICASVGVLAFWGFRQAELGMVRRAYSAANANDFSWRKRVAAYEGALQMLAGKPWFGFGWNQPEQVYDRYYRAAKVDEGMAIQLNDYFTLGTSLGLPALVCLAMYVGLSLRASPTSNVQCPKFQPGNPQITAQRLEDSGQQPEDGRQRTELPAPPTLDIRLWTLGCAAVCRAGAVLLLVGFWFDGGLFKLATGATFWILLELGSREQRG
jgi:O-Antigen ligase